MAEKLPPQTGPASKQIQLDATQFVQGMATSDYTNDGGFGSSSYGINLTRTPGVVYPMATETDISTNVAGSIIASCEDSQTAASVDRLMVDDAANLYTLSGSTVTKRFTGAKIYQAGTTDIVSFAGQTYVTSKTDIGSWNTSGAGTFDETWWTVTKAKTALSTTTRHPLLVYDGYLWVADGANLYKIDSSLNITTAEWTLNSNELIVALGIDPMTGLMLVSVVTLNNYSNTIFGKNFIYLYQNFDAKPRRKIVVDEMVTAFFNIGGTVYIGYGTKLGQWNGNGISFLRNLGNATKLGSDLPYKHHFTNFDSTLLVVDGPNILAYGPVVQGGRPVFRYTYQQGSSTHLQHIAYVGNSKVAIAYATNKLSTIDFSSTSAGTGSFYTSNVNFPRKVYIRKVRVITTGITTTSAGGIGGFALLDETGAVNQPVVKTFINTGATTRYTFDFDYSGLQVHLAQPRINFDTQGFGITRVIIYYDPAE